MIGRSSDVDRRKGGAGRFAVVSIVLITVLALASLHASRREATPPAVPQATPVAPAVASAGPLAQLWLSTADRRLRLVPQPDIEMTTSDGLPKDVVIDTHARYQSMVGFGAAMTDASAWLIHNRMSALQRRAFLREMYGPAPGLSMNMMRLTIGASDFSLQPYTLDDMLAGQTDPTLAHFNVTPNLADVVPMVREVLLVNPQLRIIASPWSAPAWMKTSASLIGGELLKQYESVYANYLVKYVATYRGFGIPIFALTVQNEPAFQPMTYPGMGMPAATRARLVGQYLGPALARRAPKTRILEWDHNWDEPDQPPTVLADPTAARYISGVAWHCYAGTASAQKQVHDAYPRKNAYITECSGGDWESAKNGELLWFARDLLLAGIRQWARGVIYWNLALDERHGPNAGGCGLCKGLVTINSNTGAVSRNDEYYAFAHFSRFVLPGDVRVGSSETDKDLNNVAFLNPSDGSVVLVVINSHVDARGISVTQGQLGFQYTMPPRSVATFVWNPNPAAAWIRRALRWLNGAPVHRQRGADEP